MLTYLILTITVIPAVVVHASPTYLQLGLTKIADTRIGSPTVGARGISGGEAKRLAFASEVLVLTCNCRLSGFQSHVILTVSELTAVENPPTCCSIYHLQVPFLAFSLLRGNPALFSLFKKPFELRGSRFEVLMVTTHKTMYLSVVFLQKAIFSHSRSPIVGSIPKVKIPNAFRDQQSLKTAF